MNTKHPAKDLGAWLKSKRQAKGIIARMFAGQIWLSPSKYAEVEIGVVKWIGEKQERIIPILLEMGKAELKHFMELLKVARNAAVLSFETIFTKDSLKPVRAAHAQGKQITLDEENALLDTVFKPLAN